MDTSGALVVSEVFGPTFQGEGPSAGRLAGFVRLGRCNLSCSWCFVSETPVLMADWSWKPLGDLLVGDWVVGLERPPRPGVRLGLVPARVTRLAWRTGETVAVNGDLRCTPDHRFRVTGPDAGGDAVADGWREVARCRGQPALFVADPPAKVDQDRFEQGRLAGMADGGCEAATARGSGPHQEPARPPHRLRGRLGRDLDDESWGWGYLGGLLDSRGSVGPGVLRIARQPSAGPAVATRISRVLDRLGLPHSRGPEDYRLHGGDGTTWRVLSCARPRNPELLAASIGQPPESWRVVSSVTRTGVQEPVRTVTTTTGSFVAGGFVVKNCDTPYTWDWDRFDPAEELRTISVTDIVEQLEGMGVDMVVVTGGEPLLQQRHLGPLLSAAKQRAWRVEVETNGTVGPELADGLVDQFNVSPKLANAGGGHARPYRPEVLRAFQATGRAAFKFVVCEPGDLAEVDTMVTECGLDPVYVMPEGTDAATVTARMQTLAEPVLQRRWNLTPRLHILLWGDRRGV